MQSGIAYATLADVSWGLFPLFFRQLAAVSALVVAGLQTGGTTLVGHIHHIERGYSDFVENLARLGARIRTTDT